MTRTTTVKTPLKAILLVVVCTLLSTVGQFCLKHAVRDAYPAMLWSPTLYAGLALYAIAAILLIIALRHGELSVLYPVVSLSLVWIMLVSATLLGERVGVTHIVGAIAIIVGISIIGNEKLATSDTTQEGR